MISWSLRSLFSSYLCQSLYYCFAKSNFLFVCRVCFLCHFFSFIAGVRSQINERGCRIVQRDLDPSPVAECRIQFDELFRHAKWLIDYLLGVHSTHTQFAGAVHSNGECSEMPNIANAIIIELQKVRFSVIIRMIIRTIIHWLHLVRKRVKFVRFKVILKGIKKTFNYFAAEPTKNRPWSWNAAMAHQIDFCWPWSTDQINDLLNAEADLRTAFGNLSPK